MIELAKSWFEEYYPVRVRDNLSQVWTRFISLCFFGAGWVNTGDIPAGVENCIIVYAPHTSNVDWVLGVSTFIVRGIPVKILIKSDWFFFPMGSILRVLGGVPVERSKSQNFVDYVADLLVTEREMRIIFCPEGTRKAVANWKTGFYHAALKAGVPLVLTSLDYDKKIACIGATFYPTGDYIADMTPVQEYYRGVHPCHPEGYNPNIF